MISSRLVRMREFVRWTQKWNVNLAHSIEKKIKNYTGYKLKPSLTLQMIFHLVLRTFRDFKSNPWISNKIKKVNETKYTTSFNPLLNCLNCIWIKEELSESYLLHSLRTMLSTYTVTVKYWKFEMERSYISRQPERKKKIINNTLNHLY